MLRTLTVLAATACLITPALAGPRASGPQGGMDRQGTPPGGAWNASPYGYYERPLPAQVYYAGYRLTPREYRRLRAMGFSRDEVFMIANASWATSLPTRVFEDAIYRGLYARQMSLDYGIDPNVLTRVLPEWRTPEWAAATGTSVYSREKLNVWW